MSHPVSELNQTINIITKGGRTNSYYKCQLNKLSCQKINNPMIQAADAARNAIFFLFLLDKNLPLVLSHFMYFCLVFVVYFWHYSFLDASSSLETSAKSLDILMGDKQQKTINPKLSSFNRRSKVKYLFFFIVICRA